MKKILLIDNIEFPSTKKHTLTNLKSIFPFTTKNQKQIIGNFSIVMSELARIVTNLKIKKEVFNQVEFEYVEGANKLSNLIANSNNISWDDMEDEGKVQLIRVLEAYLFNNGKINIFHPFIYNFIGESKNNQSVLKNIANFINDTLIDGDKHLQNIFLDRKCDNILSKLIINELEEIVEINKKTKENNYSNLLKKFTGLFKEDLKFLSKNRDFMIKNLEFYINYFVFMYCIQCLMLLEKQNGTNNDDITPLYFALEWEPITKKRKAADSIQGYKFIQNNSENIFAYEYILRLLSNNVFSENKEILDFHTLLQKAESKGATIQLKMDLIELIKKYSKFMNGEISEEFNEDGSIEELYSYFFKLVKRSMNKQAREKYGESIHYLGQGKFLKARGNLGNILNISHDFLILMTAVIVKDERKALKEVIKEFEKRGIKFDRFSIEEIVKLFDSHNILDKKSDSGDVQYVKPIL